MTMLLLLALVGGALAESITWTNQWNGGAQSAFHVHADHALHGWKVTCTFSQAISTLETWTGTVISQTATEVVIENMSFDGDLADGQDLKVDFLIRGSFPSPPSATCQLQGAGGGTGTGTGTGTVTPAPATGGGNPITSAPLTGGGSTMKYDYRKALGMSILFYDAQRSGKLPANNPISWRGDSAVNDGDAGHDLSGGWYDAGDHVKFNLPMAYSTWVLAWGFLRFKDGYEAAGQTNMMCDSIKWPLDYFLKCWIPSEQTLYVQVGNGNADHGFWGRPENMNMARPAYKVTASCPGSDVAADTAAAMAAGAMVFKDICNDTPYAIQLLTAAKSLYTFAKTHKGVYTNCVSQAKDFYGWPSRFPLRLCDDRKIIILHEDYFEIRKRKESTGYQDELATAATFMYEATKETSYLNDAKQFHTAGTPWALSWDDTNIAANLRLYELTSDASYKSDVEGFVNGYMTGGSVPHTPCGLAYRDMWGANRYAANAAFIATMAAADGIQSAAYQKFAMSQINYILGDNKYKMSYEIGFGSKYPLKPHHRGSSCSTTSNNCDINSGGPNPNILTGALVGGPDNGDNYQDSRSDYVHNEVACDYNAGFQGALAGLAQLAAKNSLPAAPSSNC